MKKLFWQSTGVGPRRQGLLRWVLVGGWLLFTISLTSWWIIFGLEQIDSLMELMHESDELVRRQKMIVWEGATLFACLIAGGAALAYFMYRERREAERVQKFLGTFSHELKTPLASLRLQAEVLREELGEITQSRALDRLVAETARLTLQLENCLFLADSRNRKLHLEQVSLLESISLMRDAWPGVSVECASDCSLIVDKRALNSIVHNIIQNSAVHGRASQVLVRVHDHGSGWVRITIEDDGGGFKGDVRRLGELFTRFYPGSGSGIGLYLVKQLVRDLGARVAFSNVGHGFKVELDFRGTGVTAGDAVSIQRRAVGNR